MRHDYDLPAAYRAKTLAGWIPEPGGVDPRAELQRWVEDRQRPWCVVLIGDVGVGKSHLGAAIFSLWCRRGYGWWFSATSAIDRLRNEAHTPTPERRMPIRQKLLDPRLLVLDDFGATRVTEFAHEEWLTILGRRYDESYPTVITANARGLEDFDVIDPRISSRFHEGLVVLLSGQDHRAAPVVTATPTLLPADASAS